MKVGKEAVRTERRSVGWRGWLASRTGARYALLVLTPIPLAYLFFALFWASRFRLQADFTGYYTAATIVARGMGARLYDLELQRQIQGEITFPYHFEIGGVLPFQYPPFAVLPFLPLARMPIMVAYYLWGGLNLGFFVATLAILSRSLPQLGKDPQLRGLLWLAL